MKTWYEKYEKIKDKAIVVGSEWNRMSEERRNKILAEKTVIMIDGEGYYCEYYKIIGNASNLSDQECAIIADEGNLCFGYSMKGSRITVYID